MFHYLRLAICDSRYCDPFFISCNLMVFVLFYQEHKIFGDSFIVTDMENVKTVESCSSLVHCGCFPNCRGWTLIISYDKMMSESRKYTSWFIRKLGDVWRHCFGSLGRAGRNISVGSA